MAQQAEAADQATRAAAARLLRSVGEARSGSAAAPRPLVQPAVRLSSVAAAVLLSAVGINECEQARECAGVEFRA